MYSVDAIVAVFLMYNSVIVVDYRNTSWSMENQSKRLENRNNWRWYSIITYSCCHGQFLQHLKLTIFVRYDSLYMRWIC